MKTIIAIFALCCLTLSAADNSDITAATESFAGIALTPPDPALTTDTFYPSEHPTIYVLGDSTACIYKDGDLWRGWAQELAALAKTNVTVDDRAISGYSTLHFYTAGKWEAIRTQLKPGDFVLIQFGHNDQKPRNRPGNYAAVDTVYPAFLEQFIFEAREQKANVVLLTPLARRFFNADGTARNTHGRYPETVRKVAAFTHTPLIDATQLSMDFLTAEAKAHGQDSTKQFFVFAAAGSHPRAPKDVKDNTHLSPRGAQTFAQLFIADAKRQNLHLADCFK